LTGALLPLRHKDFSLLDDHPCRDDKDLHPIPWTSLSIFLKASGP
jgi:hypothetical protein